MTFSYHLPERDGEGRLAFPARVICDDCGIEIPAHDNENLDMVMELHRIADYLERLTQEIQVRVK